mmetsp:Transcript_7704/g.7269  ORF Transcript_7704/g.7269 Transcript_7704/m.7269 type:complete len:230 (+) Transcript_7704:654-1343(+)
MIIVVSHKTLHGHRTDVSTVAFVSPTIRKAPSISIVALFDDLNDLVKCFWVAPTDRKSSLVAGRKLIGSNLMPISCNESINTVRPCIGYPFTFNQRPSALSFFRVLVIQHGIKEIVHWFIECKVDVNMHENLLGYFVVGVELDEFIDPTAEFPVYRPSKKIPPNFFCLDRIVNHHNLKPGSLQRFGTGFGLAMNYGIHLVVVFATRVRVSDGDFMNGVSHDQRCVNQAG